MHLLSAHEAERAHPTRCRDAPPEADQSALPGEVKAPAGERPQMSPDRGTSDSPEGRARPIPFRVARYGAVTIRVYEPTIQTGRPKISNQACAVRPRSAHRKSPALGNEVKCSQRTTVRVRGARNSGKTWPLRRWEATSCERVRRPAQRRLLRPRDTRRM